MTLSKPKTQPILSLPDHRQLPESDGTFVFASRAGGQNFQEHPQSLLLTSSIKPTLDALHPEGDYAVGQDCGIYWRLTDPPEKGAEAPDWFYVAGVPPLLDGERRRSYVMWKEIIVPLIAIEFVSGDGSEERDRTSPLKPIATNGSSGNDSPGNAFSENKAKAGKFWVYEQAIRIPFYAIYEVDKASVEVYELVAQTYQKCLPNERGHYEIGPLGVELGIWQGEYMNQSLPWLRWWDNDGNLLLSGEERADKQQQRADEEQQRADRLAAKLRELGINPDEV